MFLRKYGKIGLFMQNSDSGTSLYIHFTNIFVSYYDCDIYLKKVYSSINDDILNNFYIPILNESTSYDRVSGFFSSKALSAAARGIGNFIKKPYSKMRLLISHVGFSNNDIYFLMENIDELSKIFLSILDSDFENMSDTIVKYHIEALAWMLKYGKIEIKIALMNSIDFNSALLHSKYGILNDELGNTIVFSGSINETMQAWTSNGENITVFCSTDNNFEYISPYINEFNQLWDNKHENIFVIELPEAVKNKLIKYSCNNIDEIIQYLKPCNESLSLRYYQKEAINKWKERGNGYFEMATGTGKTVTALYCIKEYQNSINAVLIVVPTQILVTQWENELINILNIDSKYIVKCYSFNKLWKSKFIDVCINPDYDNKYYFIFTYNSLCAENIQKYISKTKISWLIISDEMHHAGSNEFSKILNPAIQYRLGLSATPIRNNDIEGNDKLSSYFGENPTYIFGIDRAINELNPDTGKSYLCSYYYYPFFIELNTKEYTNYNKLVTVLEKYIQENNIFKVNEVDKEINLLISKCEDKYPVFENIVMKLKDSGLNKKLLVYCKGGNINNSQIEEIKKILSNNKYNYMEFTEKYNDINFRNDMLTSLKNNDIDCIIAIKCLDEGIDIPDVRTAILMASTRNSAEYIQRRGRLLRNSPGKKYAKIYDIIVGPPQKEEYTYGDLRLIKYEYNRGMEYAKYSINNNSITTLSSWLQNYRLTEEDLYEM